MHQILLKLGQFTALPQTLSCMEGGLLLRNRKGEEKRDKREGKKRGEKRKEGNVEFHHLLLII